MHTVQQVLGLLRDAMRMLPEQTMPLGQSCGRVLARPVRMDIDAPPFDRAMRDGYALRAADAAAGARLKIVGRQDAGAECGITVVQGTCVAINTGAGIPAGADAVVMVEDTRLASEVVGAGGSQGVATASRALAADAGLVELLKGATPGMNIQRRGSDAAAGQEVLPAGTRLNPAGLAVASSAGAGQVWVRRPARVAVLTTGDEVVGVEDVPGATQIRNTNSAMLCALAEGAGAEVKDLGVARDEREVIRAAVRRGMEIADVLIVTGGMSMGTKDLVPGVLMEEGVVLAVESVKIKPGKTFLFGQAGERMVVGLPGNPVSGFVCFVRFVGPLLRGMMGGDFDVEMERAVCDGALGANEGRVVYQPGILRVEGGELRVTPLEWRGSADIYTLAKANGLIVHGAGGGERGAGSVVEVLRAGC